MQYKQASFLGIPRELRLQIFKELQLTATDFTVWTATKHEFLPRPELGWVNTETAIQSHLYCQSLAATCATLRDETAGFISLKMGAGQKDYRTYSLDLQSDGRELLTATWKRLPCTPDKVERLEANFIFCPRTWNRWWRSFRGDGGYTIVVQQLYKLLNRILRNGPQTSCAERGGKPMHLKYLQVNIRYGPASMDHEFEPRARSRDVDEILDDMAKELHRFASELERAGIIFGAIDEIHFCTGGKSLEPIHVIDHGNKDVPEFWKQYGFDWE